MTTEQDDSRLPVLLTGANAGPLVGPRLVAPTEERLFAVARESLAPATWRAYERAWREFVTFAGSGALPAEPSTVRAYIVALADTPRPRTGKVPSMALVDQHVAAIATLHRFADLPAPTDAAMVTRTVRALRKVRTRTGAGPKPKKAATASTLARLLHAIDRYANRGQRVRDSALLIVLAAHGLRRSEVGALDLGSLHERDGTLLLDVVRFKTSEAALLPLLRQPDPLGCPVRRLGAWVALRGTAQGPLFCSVSQLGTPNTAQRLSERSIARRIQAAATAAGLDPADYAGHSLRRGFITEAYARDVPEWSIQRSVGHSDPKTTRGYREEGKATDPREHRAHVSVLGALGDALRALEPSEPQS